MADDVLIATHNQTMRQDIHETTRQLVAHLGPTAVSMLAGAKDSKQASKWARADGPEPRPEARARLLAAHQAFLAITIAENDYIARNWFIGANPRLDRSPIEALRSGDLKEVLAAAKAFWEGTDG